MEQLLGILGLLIGVAALLLAIVSVPPELLNHLPWIAHHSLALLIAGLLAIGASLLLLFYQLAQQAGRLAMDRILGARPPSGRFSVTQVDRTQLRLAYEFIRDRLAEQGVTQVLTHNAFAETWERNHAIYRLIWDRADAPKVVGFIGMYPLTAKAAQQMLAGELRGNALASEHVLTRRAKPVSMFVGAIAAISRPSQAELLRVLRHELSQAVVAQTVPQILTSPFTPAGRRVAVKFGFAPVRVGPGPELWVRNPAATPRAAP